MQHFLCLLNRHDSDTAPRQLSYIVLAFTILACDRLHDGNTVKFICNVGFDLSSTAALDCRSFDSVGTSNLAINPG